MTDETGAPGGERPPELSGVPDARIHDVDVREQLRRGEEPFERIMTAASGLPEDDVLRVRAIFEPQPLYAVLSGRGFTHWTEQLGEEDWRVWFWRAGSVGSTGDGAVEGDPVSDGDR